MKKLFILCAALLLLFGLGTPASALQFTDDFTKEGFDIDYSLSITPTMEPGVYYADFRIVVNADPAGTTDWYIGAFGIKFFEGEGALPPNLTPDAQSVAGVNWLAADSGNLDISIPGWSRNDGKAGYYVSELYADQNVTGAADALPVLAGTDVTISFGFYGLGTLYEDGMPFQVGYYGVPSGAEPGDKYKFGQLSENLAVPEPSTMLLFGVGLLGLGGFSRKRLFK